MAKKKKVESEKTEERPPAPTPEAPMEELDKKIVAAEKQLRKLGIEKDVWVKKPIDIDPSFHFFFAKLEDPKGTLMLKQHAGISLRLLEAPPYLKRGAVKHLDELVAFVSSEQGAPADKKDSKQPQKKKKA